MLFVIISKKIFILLFIIIFIKKNILFYIIFKFFKLILYYIKNFILFYIIYFCILFFKFLIKVYLVKKKNNGKLYALKSIDRTATDNDFYLLSKLTLEKKIMQNDCPFLVHSHYFFETAKEYSLVLDYIGNHLFF